MKTTTNNAAVSEILDQQIINEISKADTYTKLKEVAKNYPDIFKDVKGYKSLSSLYEAMMDCMEPKDILIETTPETFDVDKNAEGVKQHDKKPKAPKAPKAPKEKKVKVASTFGTGIDLMCKNPDLTFSELKEQLKQKGFVNEGAMRTAHVQARHIFSLLKANKLM